MNSKGKSSKITTVLQASGKTGFRKYRELFYGKVSMGFIFKGELLSMLIGSMPGAAGILLRSKLYPCLFGKVDGKLFIGKNCTLRHSKKIRIGKNVIIDDNCVIDAKGEDNEGITIGDNVFIGRNTIIYCKNGNIHIKKGVSISANCTLFSSNQLTMEANSVVGAYSYLLSGGEYDYTDTTTKFVDQTGMETEGELVVGSNCWLGARVTVIDAACIGDHCVIGAGSVVTRPIPSNSLAFGVPASVKKSI